MNWPGDILPGMPRQPTVTSPSGRASGWPMPGSAWPGAARSREQTAWPSCHPTLSARLPRCRRHGCWARSSRCCWAGLPGTLSSAHRRIVTVNGLFRPFALAGGRAVATWNIAGGQVVLAPFAPLDTQTQAALAADAAAVMRFLGQ